MPYHLRILLLAFGLSVLLLGCQEQQGTAPLVEETLTSPSCEQDSAYVGKCYGVPLGDYLIDTVKLPANSFLENFLRSCGVDGESIHGLGLRVDSVFRVKRFRAGRPTYFFRQNDSSVSYWVYSHTPTEYLFVDFTGKDPNIRFDTLEVRCDVVGAHAQITSSLWNAMRDAGAPTELALRLSDLFAWTVDFFALATNDEFFAVYEKRSVEGVEIGVGRVLTAYYIHNQDTIKGYSFQQDSVLSYWDAQGNSLRRAFLKAPLSFTRISSHFSYARMHPILKVVKAHTGVDYAAPQGTPVMALGDGVVIAKAYDKGGGNLVKIRHNGVYTTGYLHLSRYAAGLQVGKRVQQGEVIGYVGMTGYATGPHLDFRVWKNGTPVNPLTLDSPSDVPIADSLRDAYKHEMHLQDSTLRVLFDNVLKVNEGKRD